MGLLELPNELIYLINPYLVPDNVTPWSPKAVSTLHSLALAHSKFWPLLREPLYEYDWLSCEPTALLWALTHNKMDTLKLTLASKNAREKGRNMIESYLSVAVKHSSPEIVQILMRHYPNLSVDCVSINGQANAINMATARGSVEIVKLLLDYYKDRPTLNYPRLYSYTPSPLYVAVAKNNIDIVKLLVEHGADMTGRTCSPYIPLIEAATLPDAGILGFLLEKAHIENSSDPIMCVTLRGCILNVARNGIAESLDLLLRYGADINARGGIWGMNPLLYAMYPPEEANPKIEKAIFDRGASFKIRNRYGRTTMQYAARGGATELLEQLINPTVNPEGPGQLKEHYHALLVGAAMFGHASTLELLLDKGSERLDQNIWYSLLFIAIANGFSDVSTVLISRGASITPPPGTFSGFWRGKSFLYVAAMRGDTKLVQELLSHGADPNSRMPKSGGRHRRWPYTPLQAAVWQSHYPTAKLLLDNGATIIRGTFGGHTLLMHAVRQGKLDLFQLTMERSGAETVWDDKCLQAAVVRNDVLMVKSLLIYGADAKGTLCLGKKRWSREKEGMLLVDYAASRGFTKVADSLR